ncbi:hypothetical protein [Geomicrobium sp. JCM 19055]|uniref:hypothetical protein n=1 Tax=Geomicrobium sp. JCM 19055 TaxID=1460649 RepID=UPI0006944450|nr:hypothetical protein [Geomicrobium sp. JCM 19055]
MSVRKWMPKTGQRLLSMSRRQIRFETQANVWLISLYYGLLGFLIVGIAYVLDMRLFIGEHASFFSSRL